MTLKIKFRDILRATLSFRTGNESWIGIAPDGSSYHIVSPVDTQISKGVMACNRPTDGTPFGGYSGWVYLRIPPFIRTGDDEETAKKKQARLISQELVEKLKQFGINADIDVNESLPVDNRTESESRPLKQDVVCLKCQRKWKKLNECLRDKDIYLIAYRACIDDFPRGVYVFAHRCGGEAHIPVSNFVRKPTTTKSLAGFQACPGYCYYEHSLQECPAICEGSCYRRVAARIYK